MNYTFGKTKSAVKLEILISKDPKARKKITSLLSKFTNDLLLITKIGNKSVGCLCMDLLRDNTIKRIDLKKNIADDVRSHAKNVVISRYRVFREEFCYVMNEIERQLKSLNKNSILIDKR